MNDEIFSEFKKIKRFRVINVGIVSIILSIIISVIQTVTMNEGVILFSDLLNMIIWNNVTITLPFTLTLICSHMINREYVDDTLKNILVVPIKWSQVIKFKIFVMLIVSLCLGFINCFAILFTGILLKCSGLNIKSILNEIISIEIMQLCIFIGILPIVLFFSRTKGKYIWGTILSMLIGVVGIFVANGDLVNIHPITAGFSIISYTMVPDSKLNMPISCITLVLYLLLSYIIYLFCYKKNVN